MDGSFAVQALIDSLSTPTQVATLFQALGPAIERLVTSRSGYFVILRSLERFPYEHTRCVDTAIVNNGMVVCNNRYGLQVRTQVSPPSTLKPIHTHALVLRLPRRLSQVFRQLVKARTSTQLGPVFDAVERLTTDLAQTEVRSR